ncbi:MAG TPA: hypothetical protein VIV60_35170 [Polyangiaceae bacterium]
MTSQGRTLLWHCGRHATQALTFVTTCIAAAPFAAAQAVEPRDAQVSVPGVSAPPQTNAASNGTTGKALVEPSSEAARDQLIVKLDVKLPPNCGTSVQFLERLSSRLRDVRFAELGATQALRAEVRRIGQIGYRGTMTLTFPDGHAASRAVDASDCGDATEALALIAAVAIDPSNADTSPIPRAARDDAVAKRPSTAEAPRAKDATPPTSHPSSSPVPQTTISPSSDPKPKPMLGVGAAGATYVGVSPGWLAGADFSVRLSQHRRNGFAPAIRLGFGYSAEQGVVAPGGVADFRLLSGQLDLCGWQASGYSVIELRACGLMHAAILTAQGHATDSPQVRHRPLLGFGAALELVLLPHARWGLPVRFQGFVPTTRDVFAFDPNAFHRVSGLLFGATAGAEVRFQ